MILTCENDVHRKKKKKQQVDILKKMSELKWRF